MSETMTPGAALDWMASHRGEELTDNRDVRWRVACSLESIGKGQDAWHDADRNGMAVFLQRTFRIPERELPKLPEGLKWGKNSRDIPVVIFEEGIHLVGCASDEHGKLRRAAMVALVEEFDTRPPTGAQPK